MQLYDFNIHLPSSQDQHVNDRVATEMNATNQELIDRLDQRTFLDQLAGANYMVFTSGLFMEGSAFADHAKTKTKYASFTLLVDFRDPQAKEHIEAGIAAGIHAIKFHSYQQKISASDFPAVIELCKFAEEKGLIITIDGSYGTAYMLEYDIVELIVAVSLKITKTPVVVLHSGGLKCLNMFLLAADRSNVYLETSASLPVYIGSSIEQDLAFMYKALPENRVLFATDDPYFPFQKTLETTQTFFDKHGFSSQLQERIYGLNALELLNF